MSDRTARSSDKICVDFGTALSKAVLARPRNDGAVDAASLRPLAIGAAAGEANPLFVPCAVFVGERRVHFGGRALSHAQAQADQGREALVSFKSILGAGDFARAIETLPSVDIDPSGRFKRRDLTVLFLAWLVGLIDCAAKEWGGATLMRSPAWLRYTRPAWHDERDGDAHRLAARLIEEAWAIYGVLGDRLLAPDGVAFEVALEALAAARAARLTMSIVEGSAYEGVAAALCHASSNTRSSHLLVVDVGAGTTDLAAVRLNRLRAGAPAEEIVAARRTLKLGGDALDRLVLDLLVGRARGLKSDDARARLWRRASMSARVCKEQIFTQGRGAIVYEGKAISLRLAELSADRDFKAIVSEIKQEFLASLAVVSDAARRDHQHTLDVVLAGGGANLGFVRDLVRAAKPQGGVKINILPQVAEWAHDERFAGHLAPIFPQLAIAIGGAVAPSSNALLSL